jgi:predicted nucleotidyltransferase
MQGGSHSYGLSTPTSDIDWRGVFATEDLSEIIGVRSGMNDNLVTQNSQKDEAYWELRRFFKLLQQGNTQAVEMLFSTIDHETSVEFQLIQEQRSHFLDTKKLFAVLSGYAQGERKLANGERTGKLGGKRKEAIDKYGFSPKNFVQLFRLLWAGRFFFNTQEFPVLISAYSQDFHKELMSVKTEPWKFKVEELNARADELEAEMKKAFDERNQKLDMTFNEEMANFVCYTVYDPILNDRGTEMIMKLAGYLKFKK